MKILEDTSSVNYQILKRHNENDIYASVAVVGEPADVLTITNELISSDYFDNIDAKAVSDGLPDFAGENIQSILDVANSPYNGYFNNNNSKYFRELMVKLFISALDTNYYYSPFDKNQIEHKKTAKLVILASSYASVYGYKDIDTLSHIKEVPVLEPIRAIVDYIANKYPIKGNMCVWTTPNKDSIGLYPAVLNSYYVNNLLNKPKLLVYSPNNYHNLKRSFLDILDSYLDNGNKQRLDYIIVDNCNVCANELKNIVKDIKKCKDESQLAYRNILSDDFEVIYPAKVLAIKCYEYLRKRNAFSHNISYPSFDGYLTCVDNDLSIEAYNKEGKFLPKFKYGRAAGAEDHSWFIVPMRERFVSDSLKKDISIMAPNILNKYVHE